MSLSTWDARGDQTRCGMLMRHGDGRSERSERAAPPRPAAACAAGRCHVQCVEFLLQFIYPRAPQCDHPCMQCTLVLTVNRIAVCTKSKDLQKIRGARRNRIASNKILEGGRGDAHSGAGRRRPMRRPHVTGRHGLPYSHYGPRTRSVRGSPLVSYYTLCVSRHLAPHAKKTTRSPERCVTCEMPEARRGGARQ
jgi:hypothetical protein